jgi:hypothetical protein
MSANFIHSQLETVGYVLIAHNNEVLGAHYLRQLQEEVYEHGNTIFQQLNTDDAHINPGDERRIQISKDALTEESDMDIKPIDDIFETIENQIGDLFPSLHMHTPNIILSSEGCSAQVLHTDGSSAAIHSLAADIPLSVIYPLHSGTSFIVWPGSHQAVQSFLSETPDNRSAIMTDVIIPGVRITVPTNCMLVFRQDLVHAGDAYDYPNVRLHAYFDNPQVPREPNTTYWLNDDAATLMEFDN